MTPSAPPEAQDLLSERYRTLNERDIRERLEGTISAVERAVGEAELRRRADSQAAETRRSWRVSALGVLIAVVVYNGLNALEKPERTLLVPMVNAVIAIVMGIGVPVIVGMRRALGWWPRVGLVIVLLVLTLPLTTCSFLLFLGSQWGH